MQDNLTPMMRQYREAKDSIPPDAVLLFRMGDFYEEFFEDAEVVSSTLELTLTSGRGCRCAAFRTMRWIPICPGWSPPA